MQLDTTKMKLLELTAQLIELNKQFTDAMKAKRPHSELVKIYAQIQDNYYQINLLRGDGLKAFRNIDEPVYLASI